MKRLKCRDLSVWHHGTRNIKLSGGHNLIDLRASVSLAITFAKLDDIQNLPLRGGDNFWDHANQHHVAFSASILYPKQVTWHAPQAVETTRPISVFKRSA